MPELDETDIRVRLKKLKNSDKVKVGEVYRCGYMGDKNYYCCLRVDYKKVQMVCIEADYSEIFNKSTFETYGRYIMHWKDSRKELSELKVNNGHIGTVPVTKVADSLEEFYQKKFNGEL